jgi:hypothetical protein
MVWGVIIDLTVLTLLAACLFSYLQRREDGRRNGVWALVAAVLVPALAVDIAAAWQINLSYIYGEVLFYATLLLALALRWFRPGLYRLGVRFSWFLLTLAGCSLAWMVPVLLYQALRAQPADAAVPVTRAGAPDQNHAPGGGRLIWLLFDELSYNQAFDQRFPGLVMPAFDRLKSESISFSDVQPAGYTTELVVPSYFLGHVVENLVSNLDGKPRITLAGQKGWHAFNENETLFADAQRLGWTTGLVGWYNPYCRILPETLNYCYWRMGNGMWTGTSPDQSALKNAAAPLDEVLGSWQPKRGFMAEEKHASDLQALLLHAQALVRDQSIGFVFIHLSVPHPPGIYDRRSGHDRAAGTYIDNLALADRTLRDCQPGPLRPAAGPHDSLSRTAR